MRRWSLPLWLLFGLAVLAASPSDARSRGQTVRVAVFNYYPAIFQDHDGTVKGFYVDLLAEIARQENLRIEYVPGSWSEGLERLKSGEVDLLTSVARTAERSVVMDFGQVPLLTVWGELYVPAASSLDSIQEVDGKKIAVMTNDFNARHFIELVQKFGFHCDFIEEPSFEQVFQAVRQGRADGGVANVVFGAAKHADYGLKATEVIFNPFDIYFTVAKDRNGELLATLDHYLDSWRTQGDSLYHQARLKWSRGAAAPTEVLPAWVFQAAAGLALLVAAGLVFILLLRRQVRLKTEALVQRKARLQESNDMVHLLLNSTAEAIFGLDLQGRCTFCNAACLRMLGYAAPEQLIGKPMDDLIHLSRGDETAGELNFCAIASGLKLGKEFHVDLALLRRVDGTSFAAEYWSYPIRREGQVLGAVVTFIDITERKRAEAALHQKNAELERFVYTVSHDLKSPLVTVKSFLGLLAQDLAANDGPEIEKDMSYLNAAAETMNNLISDLLLLSRAGRELGPAVEIAFQELVRQTLAALAGRFVDLAAEIRLVDEAVPLYGDPVRLGQIWSNLIENAVKYRGNSPLKLQIGVETQGQERVFFVCDNGVGIAPADREKIFGLFEQLDRRSEGSGLGLSLVQKIVESYQGRIWVESAGLGQGSCFKFTLPKAVKPN